MKNRSIVLIAVVLGSLLLACSLADLRPKRQASITATPTRTPKPTFTATATATHTLMPSPTPTPSNTPTNTPVPTETPVPSDTPLPTNTWTPTPIATVTDTPPPTNTPTATSKPQPKPTRKPTKPPTPQPTKPPPLPFTGKVTNGWPNCSSKGVKGFVKHGNNSPYVGARIGVWTDAWEGRLSGPSELDGKYEVALNELPAGKFYVAVVNPDSCSMRDGLPTAVNCQRRSNIVTVTIFEVIECEKQGTVQWSEVHFTGP